MRKYSKKHKKQAEEIFNYLYLQEDETKSDIIIGFGHFDLQIPKHCGDILSKGYSDTIIFTGGVGAGTADLNKPEAFAFLEVFKNQKYPYNPNKILTEPNSTNTGENIQFAEKILREKNPAFTFEEGIEKAIIVANPYRQRRVYLTCINYYPEVKFINCPPPSDFEMEMDKFEDKGFDLIDLLIGEIDRLEKYQHMNYIASVNIPEEIMKIATFIKHDVE